MNSPREIRARGQELAQLLRSSGADTAGAAYMHRKADALVIRLDDIKAPAANILKQEMLALGGECSNHREVILGRPERVSVHLIANENTLRELPRKLARQPFGLKALADSVVSLLDTLRRSSWEISLPEGSLAFGESPLLMGVLNCTPDSFSDGGNFEDPQVAFDRGRQMLAEGASILDIGGESSRPGAEEISAEEEIRRVLPVIRSLRKEAGALISIDTRKVEVAEAAIAEGAVMLNDISALADPRMAALVAESGVAVVLMHMQGSPETMQTAPGYEDCLDEVYRFLEDRVVEAEKVGIDPGKILVDPGLGFGKRLEDNTELLRRLGEFHSLGFPLLIGASRKSFLGALMKEEDPERRLEGSLAALAKAAECEVQVLRVHDVRESARFLNAWNPLCRASNPLSSGKETTA
ncbi:MAG: dihydropteroate synthase [Candidatus Krumholzibacteria bacterium]|jgi:dihydropteroate synthase|nr:dihydropteroate synthase [Candidatus Krumholzibacteria bacterium]MDP6668685.1 dihydropteroate synthase [Candidatus Krumholzibacteria bacterium]MDP7021778.1 dihydropteroate synthase [Candidatus Krumholzibacteria bacterium]